MGVIAHPDTDQPLSFVRKARRRFLNLTRCPQRSHDLVPPLPNGRATPYFSRPMTTLERLRDAFELQFRAETGTAFFRNGTLCVAPGYP